MIIDNKTAANDGLVTYRQNLEKSRLIIPDLFDKLISDYVLRTFRTLRARQN